MIFREIQLNRKNLVQGFGDSDINMFAVTSKDILLFEPLSSCKWVWTLLSLILLWMVTNESIVNICLLVKWTSVPIFSESTGICIKRTHELTGTLCGGCYLLLEKIGAGIRMGGCLFVLDPR